MNDDSILSGRCGIVDGMASKRPDTNPPHWKHRATRCAVEGCNRQRRKGWSTCGLLSHHRLGKSLYGAGKIDPIPNPEPLTCGQECIVRADHAGVRYPCILPPGHEGSHRVQV